MLDRLCSYPGEVVLGVGRVHDRVKGERVEALVGQVLAHLHELDDVSLGAAPVPTHGAVVVVEDVHLGHVAPSHSHQDDGHGQMRVLHQQPLRLLHV